MNMLTLALLVSLAFTSRAYAGDEGRFDARMTGNWGGARDSLFDRGVNVSLGYINEWLHNSSGGERTASAYADQLSLGADVDLNKLWGWNGSSFHVLITNRNGPQLDAEAELGTLLETHEIFGRGHYTRLTRFYFQQDLFGNLLAIKLGRGDVDFFPLSCDFINISFCGALPGYHSRGWYTWPIGQLFANATVRPSEKLYFKVGVTEVNPENLDGDQGMSLSTPDSDRDGTLTNAELGWSPRSSKGLAGMYSVGYWRDSTNYPDLLLNSFHQPLPLNGGAPLIRDTSSGYYVMARQQLTRGGGQGGLSLFANLSQADDEVNVVDQMISLGIQYTGVASSRPHDRIGLAIGRNRVGDRTRQFEQLANEVDGTGASGRGSEKPIELNYSMSFGRGLWLMPSVQLVRHPGGRSHAEDVLVWGAKLSADF